ncbi:MAG: hypothetical protein GXC94_07460 [Comamonadaceae bacterium]|jgi:hypothetical protein|nr:hypothetical protein [Comamonadaceae bacterium]
MIDSRERALVGKWAVRGFAPEADGTCRRIEALISNHLVEVARSKDGWSRLFRDPLDGRLWEFTYPQSELHGGGPPALLCIESAHAQVAYGYGP